jgi:hypothetical protein
VTIIGGSTGIESGTAGVVVLPASAVARAAVSNMIAITPPFSGRAR